MMKKFMIILILAAFVFYSHAAYGLTEAQRQEQRRQQQAAQRAYQASSETYDQVAQ